MVQDAAKSYLADSTAMAGAPRGCYLVHVATRCRGVECDRVAFWGCRDWHEIRPTRAAEHLGPQSPKISRSIWVAQLPPGCPVAST